MCGSLAQLCGRLGWVAAAGAALGWASAAGATARLARTAATTRWRRRSGFMGVLPWRLAAEWPLAARRGLAVRREPAKDGKKTCHGVKYYILRDNNLLHESSVMS